MMIVPYSVAFAANSNKKTITVDGIIYQLFDDQTAEVYKYEGTPVNVIVPSSVSDGTTTYNVTVISLLAFKGCNSLQSIELPNNVTSIESSAFEGCTALKSIEVLNVTTIERSAFKDCTALKSIDLPNVTIIEGSAFWGCTSLKSVDLPNVTSIGSFAFQECTSLKKVIMNKVGTIDTAAFMYCPSLETVEMNSVKYIGNYAFKGCVSLKNIMLLRNYPPTLDLNSGFKDVKNCKITVPFGAKCTYLAQWGPDAGDGSDFTYESYQAEELGLKGYYNNNVAGKLKDRINIDDLAKLWYVKIVGEINGSDLLVINRMKNLGVLDLSECRVVSGGSAYYIDNNIEYYTQDDILDAYSINLSILESIKYPLVKEIRAKAVTATPALESATVPSTVTELYYSVPCINYIFDEGDDLIKTLSGDDSSIQGAKNVVLGRPVANTAFFHNLYTISSTVTSVEITYNYKELPDKFFSYSHMLATCIVPSSLERICEYTFYNCDNLKSFEIPEGVREIGMKAFNGDTKLDVVICKAKTPPSANANTFSETTYTDATLYVPVGTREKYFFDPVWGLFNNIEEGLPSGVSDVMVEDVDGPVSVYDLQGIQRYHGERDAMSELPRGVYIIRHANGKAEKVKF